MAGGQKTTNGNPTFADIVQENIENKSNDEYPEHREDKLVTLRVINLPTNFDIPAIEKLFDINNNDAKVCDVVIDKINDQRVIVKIISPESIASGVLKFDQTMIHNRKIRIFLVDKCRLGSECSRRICRFGHEERLGKRTVYVSFIHQKLLLHNFVL